MGARQRVVVALVCALLTLLAGAGRALASDTEQSILMDDNELIYASPSHVESALEQIATLGVDRVKISVVWSLVAPHADSTTKPSFDATDPNAYPNGAWKRYDLVVGLARQLGLGVYFQLTAPAPAWATQHFPEREKLTHAWSEEPNPTEFGQFAQAVGKRYSGTFVPPPDSTTNVPVISLPVGPTTLTVTNPTDQSTFPTSPSAVPRVDWWGIWNEPNYPAWLSPQTRVYDGHRVALSPLLDRRLTDAAYAGLRASGHAGDTVLIAETASGGDIHPLPFIRDLYCLDGGYSPLRGTAAAALGCPTSGSAGDFVAAHPALFRAAGYAHHPYSFDVAPNHLLPTYVTTANLGALERTLDRAFTAYGQPPGIPLYLTEWGYKTDPPNPFVHTSLAEQALWLNEGQYMTWGNPRIKALAQFLLYDDGPRAGAIPGTLSYWSTFQSGLYYSGGDPKPSLAAFRLPIWVPHPRHGGHVAIWGDLRPAQRDTLQYAVVEYRSGTGASWKTLAELQTSNAEGYLLSHVAIPARGQIRLDWLDPSSGVVYYSRTVTVS